MKYAKKLIGERIYLSPMCADDAEIYTKWMNDMAVAEGLGNSQKMVSLDSEKKWLADEQGYQFAIVRSDDDTLLGNGGFNDIDQMNQSASVGLFIGEAENRNNGYGAEALGLLLDYGFDYLNLTNIMLTVYSFNEQAQRCYKKVGFKEIGRRRKCRYIKGQWHDDIFMDIIREDRKK